MVVEGNGAFSTSKKSMLSQSRSLQNKTQEEPTQGYLDLCGRRGRWRSLRREWKGAHFLCSCFHCSCDWRRALLGLWHQGLPQACGKWGIMKPFPNRGTSEDLKVEVPTRQGWSPLTFLTELNWSDSSANFVLFVCLSVFSLKMAVGGASRDGTSLWSIPLYKISACFSTSYWATSPNTSDISWCHPEVLPVSIRFNLNLTKLIMTFS